MKESIKTVETVDNKILNIPQKGIVKEVMVNNLTEYQDMYYHSTMFSVLPEGTYKKGTFEVLAELEKQVRLQKVRKIDPVITVKCSPKTEVIFSLIDLKTISPEHYEAVYTVSGIY